MAERPSMPAREKPASRPSSMFSKTCRLEISPCSWNTVAMPARAASAGEPGVTATPLTLSSPSVGRTVPLMMEISVDLPAPFSPTRPSTLCRARVRSTARSAATGP